MKSRLITHYLNVSAMKQESHALVPHHNFNSQNENSSTRNLEVNQKSGYFGRISLVADKMMSLDSKVRSH